MDCCDNIIGGKYQHYKGNYYNVYCLAIDKWNNIFVLYQQMYGDNGFWLRPYDMFFDTVEVDGIKINRFQPTKSKRKAAKAQIDKLISIIDSGNIYAKNSENEQLYCFTNISNQQNHVCVHPISDTQFSGYLTEHELANRMGYNLIVINNEVKITKKKLSVSDSLKLQIGKNDISTIEKQLNPCSIDIQIAESGFLCAKRTCVDPQSIEHISNATSLWKEIRLKPSKNQQSNYFRLRPGQTVLTHTKERIRIPDDCAGKIEIKSTYARLSLSITSGDFCNPGYDGHFPLEITNFGKHTVIIHAGETMAQLMLVPLSGPILVDYSQKATYKNSKGYDDGTPYTFWRERSIKSLRKKSGTESLIELYYRVLDNINSDNTSDIPGFRERFTDTFLTFCQKRVHKLKFQSGGSPDLKKIAHAYINREKNLKRFFEIKTGSAVGAIVGFVLTILFSSNPQSLSSFPKIVSVITSKVFVIALLVVSILLVILSIWLFIKTPKAFCTFEGYDIDTDILDIQKNE